MAIYFAGSELDALMPSDSNVTEVTTAGHFDSTYVRSAISVSTNTTSYAETASFSITSGTAWLHWEWMFGGWNGNTQSVPLELYTTGGNNYFRAFINNSNIASFQLQYWNGSAWTSVGTTFPFSSQRYVFDLRIDLTAGGTVEFYSSGDLYTSGTMTSNAFTSFGKARFKSISTHATGMRYSQIIAANESTIGMKYFNKSPTANGNYDGQWTGAVSDVNETTLNDTTAISSSTANQLETYTGAALSIPSNFTVKAVTVNARIKNDGTTPVNAQAVIRKGGADYVSTNIPMTGTSYTPSSTVFSNDPSTASAWTSTDAAAATLEFGVKSIT